MEALNKNRDNIVDDFELAGRVVKGEVKLFELLMRRHNQSLYRVIRSYLSHESDVQDTMQETYIKAYEKLHQFRGGSSFSTWLIRIGINEALMRLRISAKQQAFMSDFSNEQIEIKIAGHPENKIIHNEMKLILEKAIDNLPQKYRIVYMMKEVEDLDIDEIAISIGITTNNVKVRLHRAKKMLKDALYNLSSEAEIFTFGNLRCDQLVEKVMHRI